MKEYAFRKPSFIFELEKSNDDAMAKLNKWISSERNRVMKEVISEHMGKVWFERISNNPTRWATWMLVVMWFKGLVFHEAIMAAQGPYPAQNLFIVLKRNRIVRIVRLA